MIISLKANYVNKGFESLGVLKVNTTQHTFLAVCIRHKSEKYTGGGDYSSYVNQLKR